MRKILCAFVVIILIVPTLSCMRAPQRIGNSTSKYYIEQELARRSGLHEVSWSPNNQYVAFTDQSADMLLNLYVWKVGEDELIRTDLKGNLYHLNWSPDSRFFTVNEGVSMIGHTYIVLAEEEEIVDGVSNVVGPIWSPDSDKLLISIESGIQANFPEDLDYTLDLATYDLKTGTTTILKKGESNYYYLPKAWNKDNQIEYEKKHMGSNRNEVLKETLPSK